MKDPQPARLSIAIVFKRLGLLLTLAACWLWVESPATLYAQATESTTHSFTDPSDGTNPTGTLVEDKAGNLYGVTVGSTCIAAIRSPPIWSTTGRP